MGDIAGLIKLAALDAVEADKPVCVMYGRVVGVSPLTVDIEQKLRLSGEQLVSFSLPRCSNPMAQCSFTGISTGDTVALLREQGGQRFLVLGVV
jgi:hypothetical protein